jgi:hypothetical protein
MLALIGVFTSHFKRAALTSQALKLDNLGLITL